MLMFWFSQLNLSMYSTAKVRVQCMWLMSILPDRVLGPGVEATAE